MVVVPLRAMYKLVHIKTVDDQMNKDFLRDTEQGNAKKHEKETKQHYITGKHEHQKETKKKTQKRTQKRNIFSSNLSSEEGKRSLYKFPFF